MKTLPLSRGYVALVDDEDFDRVRHFKWSLRLQRREYSVCLYAYRNIRESGIYASSIQLHRFIMGVTDPTLEVDHKDHNGLNCQKYNLRSSTRLQNSRNQRKRNSPTSSKYKGVQFYRSRGNWQAYIDVEKKRKHLGYFNNEDDAGTAYNLAALKYFGEFAFLNQVLPV